MAEVIIIIGIFCSLLLVYLFAMIKFVDLLFSGSKLLSWTLTPLIVFFLFTVTILLGSRDIWLVIAVIAAWIFGISFIMGMWNPTRLSWCFRISTATAFVLCLEDTLYRLMEHHWKLTVPHSRGESNSIGAILLLIIIGIPSLCYTIFGRPLFDRSQR